MLYHIYLFMYDTFKVFFLSEQMITEITKPDVREYIKILSSDKYGADKDKLPNKEETLHTSSSYRKLNVD